MIIPSFSSSSLQHELETIEYCSSESDSSCHNLSNFSDDMTDSDVLDSFIEIEDPIFTREKYIESENYYSKEESKNASMSNNHNSAQNNEYLQRFRKPGYPNAIDYPNDMSPSTDQNNSECYYERAIHSRSYGNCTEEYGTHQQQSPDSQNSYHTTTDTEVYGYHTEDHAVQNLDMSGESESCEGIQLVSSTTSPIININTQESSNSRGSLTRFSDQWKPTETAAEYHNEYNKVDQHIKEKRSRKRLQDVYIVDDQRSGSAMDGEFDDPLYELNEAQASSSTFITDNLSRQILKVGKKRGPRPKILSRVEKKQKRLDANDRERQRMGQLNTAFNLLRNLLPKHPGCPDRELSKFETVQIAKNYIRALNAMLTEAQNPSNYTTIDSSGQRPVF